MRIGLFGGSFDPIHHGHLISAQEMLREGPLDRVIFVPAREPPHKEASSLAPAEERVRMIELAIAREPRFAVSDVELGRPGPSYTIDTVESFLARTETGEEYFWIVGDDSVRDIPGWREAERLLKICRFLVATRRGEGRAALTSGRSGLSAHAVESLLAGYRATPTIEISGTEIRRRISRGESIAYQVPEAVEDYIRMEELYRA
ncbi:MAG: nicotinate-nucleotide adenylyltransferase [Planctomycetes bacterium]|nr:nicotinate-nucleotide adenylyltransferase [Planctomycetota bacterium]